jgi:hypothetical protein
MHRSTRVDFRNLEPGIRDGTRKRRRREVPDVLLDGVAIPPSTLESREPASKVWARHQNSPTVGKQSPDESKHLGAIADMLQHVAEDHGVYGSPSYRVRAEE